MDPTDPLYRYHRQTLLPGVGIEGQRRLRDAHAMVVGLGALGCPVADLLARAGVGRLTLVDRDVVEGTNLQRQTLYSEEDAARARPKAEAARARLRKVNADLRVESLASDLEPRNAEALALDGPLGPPGVIIDGTDNVETRFLLNDLCVKREIPLVYGGAISTRGMCLVVQPGRSPCLRCVFGTPDALQGDTCDTVGVLGPVASMIGACQAAEAIKLLLGRDELVSSALRTFDLWTLEQRRIELGGAQDPGCTCCVQGRYEFLNASRASRTVSMCGQGSTQISPDPGRGAPDLDALAQSLQNHGVFSLEQHSVVGTLSAEMGENGEPVRVRVFADGRTILSGITDPGRARGVYARYVGG